jgi:hypothetical protein
VWIERVVCGVISSFQVETRILRILAESLEIYMGRAKLNWDVVPRMRRKL